jgi:hypothetical protein
MKRYESFLTEFSFRIDNIYKSLAGDAALTSTPDEYDAVIRSTFSRFSVSIPSSDLVLDGANFSALHRFLHRFSDVARMNLRNVFIMR